MKCLGSTAAALTLGRLPAAAGCGCASVLPFLHVLRLPNTQPKAPSGQRSSSATTDKTTSDQQPTIDKPTATARASKRLGKSVCAPRHPRALRPQRCRPSRRPGPALASAAPLSLRTIIKQSHKVSQKQTHVTSRMQRLLSESCVGDAVWSHRGRAALACCRGRMPAPAGRPRPRPCASTGPSPGLRAQPPNTSVACFLDHDKWTSMTTGSNDDLVRIRQHKMPC